MKLFFAKLGLKLTKKGLTGLRDTKKVNLDLDENDKNDLTEGVEGLDKVINNLEKK